MICLLSSDVKWTKKSKQYKSTCRSLLNWLVRDFTWYEFSEFDNTGSDTNIFRTNIQTAWKKDISWNITKKIYFALYCLVLEKRALGIIKIERKGLNDKSKRPISNAFVYIASRSGLKARSKCHRSKVKRISCFIPIEKQSTKHLLIKYLHDLITILYSQLHCFFSFQRRLLTHDLCHWWCSRFY